VSAEKWKRRLVVGIVASVILALANGATARALDPTIAALQFLPVRRAASASFVRATGTSRYRLSAGEEGGLGPARPFRGAELSI
jgi:hypothetical protein